ncbi:MAG: hypothetical protein LC647_15480 [Beggiatoa sp.]|nr:hypothetical protein [Beggiatoa sp.]
MRQGCASAVMMEIPQALDLHRVFDGAVMGVGDIEEDVLDPLSEGRDLGILEPHAAEAHGARVWDRTPGLSVAITSILFELPILQSRSARQIETMIHTLLQNAIT